MLRHLIMPLLFVLPITAVPMTFTAAGTFTNGAVLAGTVTVDPSTGQAQSVALSISTSPVPLFFSQFTQTTVTNGTTYVDLIAQGGTLYPNLALLLPVSTLLHYTGGSICAISNPCPGNGVNLVSGVFLQQGTSVRLQTGSLTASIPEPSTLLFTSIGVALLLARRRTRPA